MGDLLLKNNVSNIIAQESHLSKEIIGHHRGGGGDSPSGMTQKPRGIGAVVARDLG